MKSKDKVTFSKMRKCWHDPGMGDWTIYWRGAEIGSIEKFSDAEDVGILTMVWKYTVESYDVTLWTESEKGYVARTFKVKHHNGCPRATLAAAKQWARDRVQRTIYEPDRTVPIQLGRLVEVGGKA